MDKNYNSGHRNSGSCNTGSYNSGHRNSGNFNSGSYNNGSYNSGSYNSGSCNSGHRNSGHRNSGPCNSGDYNSGHRNSGNYNSGDFNSGFFCTGTPNPMFFDQPTGLTWDQAQEVIPYIDMPVGTEWVPSANMTDDEMAANPNHTTIGGYLKVHDLTIQKAFPIAWAKMDQATKDRFLNLPNFDAAKFFACTGVDVRKPEPAKEIIVDGVRYTGA